jgi:hypothetical protein
MGLPQKSLNNMQRTQNMAAKVILRKHKWDSSSECLITLHWLTVEYRILFKVMTIVYKCLQGTAPMYLREVISMKENHNARRLRSIDNLLLYVPRTKNKTFADRSFSVFGPKNWNLLPYNIRSSSSLLAFRKQLKTHYFKLCHKL